MKKVAIVGTGIAGMSAAYFLKDQFDLTIFEKNDYVGGHTNTVFVEEEGQEKPIDTGFIVFNEATYTNLIKLFRELDVPYYDTDMSFSVRESASGLEYNGSSLWNGLFAQKKNLFNLPFWKMLLDIRKLRSNAQKLVDDPRFENLTLRDLVLTGGYGKNFLDHFIVPMSSAVWSTPHDKILDFPARTLIRFYINHSFLGLNHKNKWKTVIGGSETYKQKLVSSVKDRIQVGNGVKHVEVKDGAAELTTVRGEKHTFDHVIFASHADESLRMIKNPTDLQKELLSPFKYQENIALLHSDSSVMPRLERNWSSWNFVYKEGCSYTVYYMNRLQKISSNKDYFVSINGEQFVDKAKVIRRIVYHHPLFDRKAIKTQPRLPELNQGNTPLYFCGSYFRYGLHEDALLSSVQLCERILGRKVLK